MTTHTHSTPSFPVGPYAEVAAGWPRGGHPVLASHTEDTIVLYQAYNDKIADYAVRHGVLSGPDFSLTRMSWAKPNFLWMMYRSGWGTKPNQTRTLALHISKDNFYRILEQAHVNQSHGGPRRTHAPMRRSAAREDQDEEDAKEPIEQPRPAAAAQAGEAVSGEDDASLAHTSAPSAGRAKSSSVVVQWDPDHSPCGGSLGRRAVQIGMRGETLRLFASEWILRVEDISEFVRQQRPHATTAPYEGLLVPRETVLPLPPAVARHACADLDE
eukprot:m.239818 g.239818  ORF g.239818 m.239818 type:complete len:271 (-) comp22832_c0_seq1:35-847(-)